MRMENKEIRTKLGGGGGRLKKESDRQTDIKR